MKLIEDIVLTKVADDYIAVPVGDSTDIFKGIIRLNKTGMDIWEGLSEGLGEEAIAQNLIEKYEGVDRDSALSHIRKIIEQLKQAGVLIEEQGGTETK